MSLVENVANRATAAPPDALIDKRNGKPKRPTRAIRQVVDLVRTGACTTWKAAAERVGLHPDHVSRALAQPHVQAFIASEGAKTIAAASLPAARKFAALVDATSEHVAAKVSDRILTSAGILKAESGSQVSVGVNVSVGYVLDLREERPHAAAIAHDRTIEAKALTDKGDGQ